MTHQDYLLGMEPGEVRRLENQHLTWQRQTERVWQLARFAPGDTIIDLGCGPGFTSRDLARLVGKSGRVIGVDSSREAIEHLRAAIERDGLPNIEVVAADVMGFDPSRWNPDGVFIRWVFCFLQHPDELVQQVASHLKKGARVAAMDYWNYLAVRTEPGLPENEYEKVRAENDWNSEQVARYPDRLVGFCGLNPLKDYALEELARCAKNPQLRHGLKLHFGNSVVDYHNAQHVEQLRRVFRAANDYRMPIVVHMRASVSQKLPYGRDEALVFLNDILPAAPDIVVQIAHLAGAGAPNDPVADQALAVFTEAIAKGDPRTKLLWFDVTGVALKAEATQATRIATQIRELGVQRILYGSDAATPTNLPRDGWAWFQKLPLSDAEFQTIANNVPPYMR